MKSKVGRSDAGKFALLSNIFLMISKIAEININLCGNGRRNGSKGGRLKSGREF